MVVKPCETYAGTKGICSILHLQKTHLFSESTHMGDERCTERCTADGASNRRIFFSDHSRFFFELHLARTRATLWEDDVHGQTNMVSWMVKVSQDCFSQRSRTTAQAHVDHGDRYGPAAITVGPSDWSKALDRLERSHQELATISQTAGERKDWKDGACVEKKGWGGSSPAKGSLGLFGFPSSNGVGTLWEVSHCLV